METDSETTVPNIVMTDLPTSTPTVKRTAQMVTVTRRIDREKDAISRASGMSPGRVMSSVLMRPISVCTPVATITARALPATTVVPL